MNKKPKRKVTRAPLIENKKIGDLSKIIVQYSDRFGEGVFWDLSKRQRVDVPIIKTRLIGLNWAIGVGGLPIGRPIEIFGRESSGKTTLCYQAIAAAQKVGLAGFIDTEGAFDSRYAAKCGVDCEHLIFAQPDYGEQALQIFEDFIQDERLSIVVLDSLASLSPRAEAEGEIGDQYMGLSARMLSQSMRRLPPFLKKTKAVIIVTNQVRANLSGYGAHEETGGGFALKHALQVRLHLKKKDKLISAGKEIGFLTEIFVKKNKIATPFRRINVPILYGRGYDYRYELITLGLASKVLTKSMASYKVGNHSLGKGWKKAYEAIRSDLALRTKVKGEIAEYLKNLDELDT